MPSAMAVFPNEVKLRVFIIKRQFYVKYRLWGLMKQSDLSRFDFELRVLHTGSSIVVWFISRAVFLVDALGKLAPSRPSPWPQEPCQLGNSSEDLDRLPLCALTSTGLLSLALCGGLFPVWSDWAAIEWHNCLPVPGGGWLAFCSCQTGPPLRRLTGKISHQCSFTSQISCCLPKIRIITAAHPASQCHLS